MSDSSVTLFFRETEPYSPQHFTTERAREILAGIQIPPQPDIVRALLHERSCDAPDLGRIALLIGHDAGLTAGLLKTVNAPYYGLRTKVTSVKQAVNYLGMTNVSTLIMGLALRKSLMVQGMEDFWDSSNRESQLAGLLASRLGLPLVEEARLFALFHDCAMLLLTQRVPGYRETMELGRGVSWCSVTELERSRHALDHAVLGSLLADEWGLPDSVMKAIRWHHSPSAFSNGTLTEDVRILIALGHVVDMVEDVLSRRRHQLDWSPFGTVALHVLMLPEAEAQEFLDAAMDQFAI